MYTFTGIEKFPKVKFAISTISDGNMSYIWGERKEVLANRKRFLEQSGFNINTALAVRISDSTNIKLVDRADIGKGIFDIKDAIKADGVITKEAGVVLFLVVADCSPVIIYDDRKEVLALVHINWKNTEIIRRVLEKMTLECGSNRKNLNVFIGPSIQQESFKFVDPLQKNMAGWEKYLKDTESGETKIDMVGFIKDSFIKNGISKNRIYVTNIDTFKEKNLFSHYRSVRTGEKEGRFAVVVKLI